ncbi:MAG: ABC transporter substrate-binding protein, partial [Bacteroidia bacterium]
VSPIKKEVYNNDLKPLPFDLEQAKQLLDEAGWKDTDGDNIRDKTIDGKKIKFEFEFSIIGGAQITVSISKRIAESMRMAGVVANVHPYDFAKFYENNRNHDFDMYLGSWSSSFVPEDYKQIWHSGSWENGGSNYVGFGTPATDQLIEEIRAEVNDSARIVMEKKLQAIVYDEQPYIFMYLSPRKVVIHRRFANPDMYFEKPGICLSNLRSFTSATIAQPAVSH